MQLLIGRNKKENPRCDTATEDLSIKRQGRIHVNLLYHDARQSKVTKSLY